MVEQSGKSINVMDDNENYFEVRMQNFNRLYIALSIAI
jgi:hypothetical protein